MKFDDFLATVDDWGKFQKIKYGLICLTYMLPPIMVYTYTFTAAVPNFRCQDSDMLFDDGYFAEANTNYNSKYLPTQEQCTRADKLLSLKECQRCYIQTKPKFNQTANRPDSKIEKCNKHVFEKIHYDKTLVEEWDIVCDRIIYRSAAQIVFFVGYMVGSVVFGILADKYGRRPIMSVSFILLTASGLLCAYGPHAALGFWPSYIIFVLSRFLIACATRGISVSGFVLGSEIVGPSKRLLTGIVIEYFFVFGQYFLVAFAFFIRTWRALTGAITLFTVPFMFFYFILPESPRWLVSRGRFDDAEKVLRKIASDNKRDFDPNKYQQLKEEQQKHMKSTQHQQGIMSLFRSKIMCIISFNLFLQWLVQNLVFYGVSQNTGSWDLNPYLSFALSATVELVAYIVVHLILDRVGRKLPYCLFSMLFGIIALLTIPVQKYMPKQIILMTIINLLLKFLASGSYAIIYIYANELFPTNVRNTGMGICSMVARIGAIIGTFCNDYLTRIWIYLPIVLYGIVSLISAILALMFPETLNKSLPQTVEDVERMGIIGMKKKQFTSTLPESEALTGNNEDIILKENIQANDISDSKI
ncbi:unnamed protein product [Adineta steineri]|uniref:Major facilitator superfamily (MFS) profile domain-containing protein n=1 Tax=Adineta steineri TaxID=433720 RepID=A0A814LWK4_9BILA|nr:unnamed protein product [Adineta steineri]CAF1070614.1 unnamed protein product [Adineta steineri]